MARIHLYGTSQGDKLNCCRKTMNRRILDWAKFSQSPLHQKIISSWEAMLEDDSLKERDYHRYLFLNPAIFLTTHSSYLVASKVKIGAEYETDFVIANEGYSDGTQYTLIEIESPHSKLFDASGKPAAGLNAAIQQIRDWRRLLIEDRALFKRIFPTTSTRVIRNSKLRFKIVIGRRSSNAEHLEKRRQISEIENIEIISFDRLTDFAKRKIYFPKFSMIFNQTDDVPSQSLNELVSPFFQCVTDSEWRAICKNGNFHFYRHVIDKIIEYRKYNSHLEEFTQQQMNGSGLLCQKNDLHE